MSGRTARPSSRHPASSSSNTASPRREAANANSVAAAAAMLGEPSLMRSVSSGVSGSAAVAAAAAMARPRAATRSVSTSYVSNNSTTTSIAAARTSHHRGNGHTASKDVEVARFAPDSSSASTSTTSMAASGHNKTKLYTLFSQEDLRQQGVNTPTSSSSAAASSPSFQPDSEPANPLSSSGFFSASRYCTCQRSAFWHTYYTDMRL
jgi:hypothetical protein